MKDFSGAGVMSLDFGYNVIMIDQRAHGHSDGCTITFGEKEKRDAISWVNYVRERFGKERPVILQGISMGAATVILASAENDLPNNVMGTMADCPYSSTKKIIKKVVREMHLPANVLYPFIRLGAIIFGGFDPNKTDIALAASNAKIPIMLVHGTSDSFVPYCMSEEIAKSKHVTFHTYEGADHGISFLIDEARYRRTAEEFMKERLTQKGDNKNDEI
jgi:pimeloyl-ACP methyl ester carboxylesterase